MVSESMGHTLLDSSGHGQRWTDAKWFNAPCLQTDNVYCLYIKKGQRMRGLGSLPRYPWMLFLPFKEMCKFLYTTLSLSHTNNCFSLEKPSPGPPEPLLSILQSLSWTELQFLVWTICSLEHSMLHNRLVWCVRRTVCMWIRFVS